MPSSEAVTSIISFVIGVTMNWSAASTNCEVMFWWT